MKPQVTDEKKTPTTDTNASPASGITVIISESFDPNSYQETPAPITPIASTSIQNEHEISYKNAFVRVGWQAGPAILDRAAEITFGFLNSNLLAKATDPRIFPASNLTTTLQGFLVTVDNVALMPVGSDIGDNKNNHLSSIKINIDNIHELCNLGARKLGLIEDSIHTEKHRGYHYEHAFSYDWNAMQGFHLLMRMAHTVNALSEFTKKIKTWIKAQGVGAILKVIRETLFNPWLPIEWYDAQTKKPVQLKLQLE